MRVADESIVSSRVTVNRLLTTIALVIHIPGESREQIIL